MKKTFITAARTRGALFATAGVAALALAQPAMAQEADEDETAQADEPITVTGTRIILPNLRSTEPTVSITDDFIDQRNFINVADALNDLPIIRGSVTPDGGQASFGQGVNFINIFGLGTNRSLTLVNGRRVVSSNTPTLFGPGAPGLQVDLNVIPAALVERVDIASTAGAPVYGSDAIAGTVNLILNDDYEGLEINATTSMYEEGDGFQYRVEGVFGTKFADGRGSLQISSFYTQTEGILQNQRQLFRDNIEDEPNLAAFRANAFRLNQNGPNDTGPNDGVAAQVAFRNVTLPDLSNMGVIFGGPLGVRGPTPFGFDAAGNLNPYNAGLRLSGLRAAGGEGFQFVDFGQLTSDLRRFGVNVFANYDVTDNVNIFTELQYYDARADELVQQPSFNTVFFGGGSSALTFPANHPFLNAQARGVLAANRVTNFTISRANVGFADLTGFAETELLRGVFGARGDYEFLGKGWNWEASLTYGATDVVDLGQDINQQNFTNAVNVAVSGGRIICAANAPGGFTGTPVQAGFTPRPDPNCVPFNFFGLQATPAALQYVIQEQRVESRLEQVVFNINTGGTLFELFGNEVGVNVGYEHRRESGDFLPDEFTLQGQGRAVAIPSISGSFNVDEVFGEIVVPVITPSNDLFIESLQVYGRGRYVDNTVNGGFFSWAAGGSIAFFPDVEFRGNFTRSFRAPSITELFLPAGNAFGFVPDLCFAAAPTQGPNPAARQRNCAAFLAAFPGITRPQLASNASIPILTGGNPNLGNEEADSWSLGTIIRPSFIDNLSLTVDYVNISISNPISNLTSGQINSACFDNNTFNTADPANGNQFCSLIRRTATGEVVADPSNPGVRTGFVNGNAINFEGVQAEMLWSTPLDDLIGVPGSFSLRGSLQVTLRREVDITGVAPARSDAVIGDPTWQGQLQAQYAGDNFGFGTVLNYVGEQLFSRFDRRPDSRQFDQLDGFVVQDFNIYFETDDDFRFNFVVNNLWDRRCAELNTFCIPGGINDAFGRSYSIGVTKEF